MSGFVGAVVLNWNNAADTSRCVTALQRGDYRQLGIVIVDNASTDGSAPRLRHDHPDVPVITTDHNSGYTGGNNLGIAFWLERQADLILLINDDALPELDMVSVLVQALAERPQAGLAGPKVCMLEEPQRLLSAGGKLVGGWRPELRGLGEIDHGQYEAQFEADFLSGCALLVTRAMVEAVGLLDQSFFAYFEDVDWCYRARRAGYASVYVPVAKVLHPDTRRRDGQAPSTTYYMARNQLLFIRKHRLGGGRTLRSLGRHLRTLLSWSVRPKWRSRRPARAALARALIDFALRRSGPLIA